MSEEKECWHRFLVEDSIIIGYPCLGTLCLFCEMEKVYIAAPEEYTGQFPRPVDKE